MFGDKSKSNRFTFNEVHISLNKGQRLFSIGLLSESNSEHFLRYVLTGLDICK